MLLILMETQFKLNYCQQSSIKRFIKQVYLSFKPTPSQVYRHATASKHAFLTLF